MIGAPFRFYRTVKTSDGEGGYTESGTLLGTYFGTLSVHENVTTINLDVDEDVIIGDLVEGTDDVYYRVKGIGAMIEKARQVLMVERVARPIWAGKSLT